MSVQAPSHSPPTLVREQAAPPSGSLGDAPIIHSSPIKKTIGKRKKAPKKRVVARTTLSEPTEPHATQRARFRYEPYQKADPTPEPELNRPASSRDLEALDVTVKTLYKSDREVLEYIEALNRRTAAILEHVNRTSSKLRSCEGIMERIELFVGQRQETDDRWADEEENSLDPDLSPAPIHNENDAFPTVKKHPFQNPGRPVLPYDYARSVLGESAPQPPSNHAEEEDLFRQGTPPSRQPSLPPGYEDENVLEYAEDMLEMCSDFPVPPDHAALASDDSTFNRSGADLRIASDTGLLFPPSEQELARVSREFKREAMNTVAALSTRPSTNFPHPHHPLEQSRIPSSGPIAQPEIQHLVPPISVLRTPSPSRVVLGRKRKRFSTPENEEDSGAGNIDRPSTNVPRQVGAKRNGDRTSAKRRRLSTGQPTWDSQVFLETDPPHTRPRADPPTRENSPEPLSQPGRIQGPLFPIQTRKGDSEVEGSQFVEMLSRAAEQGESEGEGEPTLITLPGPWGLQHTLPAQTVENSQPTSTGTTQPKLQTPAKPQAPADALTTVPEDVFGPIIFSVKANKVSDRLPAEVLGKDPDGGISIPDPEHETANVANKCTRFNLGGEVEKKERKIFRKTPARPGAFGSEDAPGTKVKTTSRSVQKTLPSSKKKRSIGVRTRKQKATSSIEPEPAINPEDGLPSISASKPPPRLRRGRSATVRPQVPLSKAPVRRSTRSRKKV